MATIGEHVGAEIKEYLKNGASVAQAVERFGIGWRTAWQIKHGTKAPLRPLPPDVREGIFRDRTKGMSLPQIQQKWGISGSTAYFVGRGTPRPTTGRTRRSLRVTPWSASWTEGQLMLIVKRWPNVPALVKRLGRSRKDVIKAAGQLRSIGVKLEKLKVRGSSNPFNAVAARLRSEGRGRPEATVRVCRREDVEG